MLPSARRALVRIGEMQPAGKEFPAADRAVRRARGAAA